MDGGGRHVKARPLRLARPLQGGGKVGIELVGFHFLLRFVVLGHAHRRVVGPLFIVMGVGFDVAHFGGISFCRGVLSWTGHLEGLLCCSMSHFTRFRREEFIEQDLISLFSICKELGIRNDFKISVSL